MELLMFQIEGLMFGKVVWGFAIAVAGTADSMQLLVSQSEGKGRFFPCGVEESTVCPG